MYSLTRDYKTYSFFMDLYLGFYLARTKKSFRTLLWGRLSSDFVFVSWKVNVLSRAQLGRKSDFVHIIRVWLHVIRFVILKSRSFKVSFKISVGKQGKKNRSCVAAFNLTSWGMGPHEISLSRFSQILFFLFS